MYMEFEKEVNVCETSCDPYVYVLIYIVWMHPEKCYGNSCHRSYTVKLIFSKFRCSIAITIKNRDNRFWFSHLSSYNIGRLGSKVS